MTLELSPELESQIENAARLRGVDASAFVIEAAQQAVENQKEERRAIIARLKGCLKDSRTEVDDFLRERSEEAKGERIKEQSA